MSSPLESVHAAAGSTAATHGAYRWFVVFLGWLALDFTFVDRLAWGTVAVQASDSLGLPLMSLGVFVTAFFCGYVIANALGGLLTDRVGGRVMLASTIFILGLLTFCFSMTTSVAMGMMLQALMGLAAGADIAATVKLVTAWFGVKDRGKAIGFLLTAAPCSVMITNAVVPSLMRAVGWHAVYQILGVCTAAFGLLSYLLVRDSPVREARHQGPRMPIWPLLRNPQFVLLLVAGFGGYWAVWGFAFLVNALMVKQHGLSPVAAGAVVIWFGATSLVSKPIVGFISDAMGGVRKPLMLGIMAAFAVMMIAFSFVEGTFALTVAAAAVGFFSLAWSPLMTATVAESGGRSRVGLATGVANGLWQFAGVWSPAAAGLVFQWTHAYHAPFYLLAAGPIVSTIALVWVKDGLSAEGR
ncbi:MFS transporter [Burkholderia sp. SFA1]|uniref:D-galactonate transporter n=1 Tax=Caballeronia cordobensis TaxID=1353886 RepID=A0A158GSB3_CABCO|nr:MULTISPECIES: MFS transporter [Caballeronia]MCE4573712.1 MFS transporter [Caballeronia sp. CLC5]BBQ00557.1 MFS transporter [Burkholderia sp. SFA1]SAL35006.1 d-galactonate transporter [Caballeronia cordobensis]